MATALLATKSFSGLRKSEIQPLFKQFGKNTFNQRRHSGFLYAVWNIFKEPMFLMLLFASSLYFILGETKRITMLVAMIFVVAISIYRSQKLRALQALKQLPNPG
jgi:Ca2+-transporting ATPase